MNEQTRNKELIRSYLAALNAHDLDAAAGFVADDLVNHAAIPEAQGASGLKTILTKVWKAMPDQTWSCEDLLAEGDRVVARLRMRGTQSGPIDFTRMQLPATGRECSVESIHVHRIADGKIVEHWAGRDDLSMMRQLGHFPAPGAQ